MAVLKLYRAFEPRPAAVTVSEVSEAQLEAQQQCEGQKGRAVSEAGMHREENLPRYHFDADSILQKTS